MWQDLIHVRHVPHIGKSLTDDKVRESRVLDGRKVIVIARARKHLLNHFNKERKPNDWRVIGRISPLIVIDRAIRTHRILNVSGSVVHPRRADIAEIIAISHLLSIGTEIMRSSPVRLIMQRRHRQLIDIDVIKGRVIVRCRASFQELRLHLRVRDRHDRHRAVLMEVLVMYLTVQQLRVEVEILSVDMPEYSDVLCTSLDRKRNGERITVCPREVVVLGDEIKRSALLQDSPLFINQYNHERRDLGVLLRISLSYSSCACFMPVSPVTELTVRKGSSNLSRRRRIVSA